MLGAHKADKGEGGGGSVVVLVRDGTVHTVRRRAYRLVGPDGLGGQALS